MNSRKVTIAPEVTLDWLEGGDPSGQPVLLLHGYSDSLHSYRPLLAMPPAGLRLIALSHRGHGGSDKPASRYDAAELADDVARFMDALGIARAVLVGHSMSSQVAQRLAAHHPGRTQALILMGAFTTLKGHAEIEALRQVVEALDDPVDPAFVRDFQQGTLARPVPSWFFETIVGESLRVPAHVWRSALAAQMAQDSADYLPAIGAPTLVLWGDQDGVALRPQQQLLASGIADVRLKVYRGVGHSPHWEDPHRVAADMEAFLRERLGVTQTRAA